MPPGVCTTFIERGNSHIEVPNPSPIPRGSPFVLRAADFAPWAVGHYWGISSPSNYRLRDVSEVTPLGRQDYEHISTLLGGSNWPDQAYLHSMRYGMSHQATTLPWAVVICPPNLSARPYLDELAAISAKAAARGWVSISQKVPLVQNYASPYGMTIKYDRAPRNFAKHRTYLVPTALFRLAGPRWLLMATSLWKRISRRSYCPVSTTFVVRAHSSERRG